MAETTNPLPARFPSLDGVRGVAILLVLFHQFSQLDTPSNLFGRVVDLALDRGWIGVQLFFVLSGFLITGILVDSRGEPGAWKHFVQRRILRIFPLYFGALFLFTVVFPRIGVAPPGWADHTVWYWLFLSNWTQASQGGALPHFWSLAVEEQFYLLWPLAALLLDRRSVVRACVAVVVLAFVARLGMRYGHVAPEAIYVSTLSRMDALACGAGAALGIRMPQVRAWIAPRQGALWGGLLGVLALGFALSQYDRTSFAGQAWGYPMLSVALGGAILLLAAADARGGRTPVPTVWLASATMRRFGLYSFAMYVFHKPFHDLVGRPLLSAWGYPGALPLGVDVAYVAGAIAAVTAIGAVSYHAFERHFLALGRRRSPAPPPAREV